MEPDVAIRCHNALVASYAEGTIALTSEMPDGTMQRMMITPGDFKNLKRAADMLALALEADG